MEQQLTTLKELFCSHVAAGMSQRKAAVACGWTDVYGFKLMSDPLIKERVASLIAIKAAQPPDSIASKPWIETKLVQIIVGALNPKAKMGYTVVDGKRIMTKEPVKDDPGLARMALMDLARLKGYIVTKSEQKTEKLDLRLASTADLSVQLKNYLNLLKPGRAAEVLAITQGIVDVDPDDDDDEVPEEEPTEEQAS